MSVLQLILGVLSLLVAVSALIWQVFAADLKAWLPIVTGALVTRAVRKLPIHQRQAQREEWLSELSELPKEAIVTQIAWAWDFGRAARNLNGEESGRPGLAIKFKAPSVRHFRSHRADLRVQAWLAGDRARFRQLLSYLSCLVIYEWNGSSTPLASRAMGCSGHVVQAGIARLEQALDEVLVRADGNGKLTPLGEDIAVAARPLVSSLGATGYAPPLSAMVRQAINAIVSGYAGETWAGPAPEAMSTFGMAGEQLRLFDPMWMPAPRRSSKPDKEWVGWQAGVRPAHYQPGQRFTLELELAP
jgi:hypothetical protein